MIFSKHKSPASRIALIAFILNAFLGGQCLVVARGMNCINKSVSYLHVQPRALRQADELSVAAALGDTKKVKALIAATVDLNIGDFQGRTPVMFACETAHKDIVQLLIKAGADVNLGDTYGTTALMHAAKGNNDGSNTDSIIGLLIEAGAHINVGDENGETALMYAAYSGHDEAVESLIRRHANVNARDKNGATPLMYVAYTCFNDRIVSNLIAAKADVNAKDHLGQTAASIAWNHFRSCAHLLERAGAKSR